MKRFASATTSAGKRLCRQSASSLTLSPALETASVAGEGMDQGRESLGLKAISVLVALGVLGGLTGCGGGGSQSSTPPPPAVSVSFSSPPPTSVDISASVPFTAVVSNASNTTVTWSVACGSPGNCGSFPIIEGYQDYASYNAPDAIPAGKTVTVTATSVADPSKSVSATMTATAKIAITSPIPASLQVNRSATMQAVIGGGSSPSAQAQWTLTCSASDCGALSSTVTSNLSPATTYTAPASVPPGSSVTLTVTSVEDPTQSVSANIGITPQGPMLANGTYVFQLDLGGHVAYVTGVIVAQDGVITGGEQDEVMYGSPTGYPPVYPQAAEFDHITSGSYATTPDGNLHIFWNAPNGTMTGVLVPGAQGFVGQISGVGGSGTLELQTRTSPPSGGYAFSLQGGSASFGGILNVDGSGTISGAGSLIDYLGSIFVGAQPVGASTVSAPDQYGRVVFQLQPGSSSVLSSLYLVGYIVDATHIRLIETSGDNYGGVLGGMALGQGTDTGQFSNGSLAGSTYVFGASGFSPIDGNLQTAGEFTANSDGTVTGELNWNGNLPQGIHPPRPFTGTWSIDPIGRVVLSNLTDGVTFTYNLDLYLTGDGNGLLLSNSTNGVELAGQIFQQQGPFTATTFSGSYGLNAYGSFSAIFGPIQVVANNGTDAITGFADTNNGPTDFPLSGSLTYDTEGILAGTLTGLNIASPTTPGNFAFYLVDSNRAVAIELDNTPAAVFNLMYLQRLQ